MWVVLVDADDAFLVAGHNGQFAVREEEIGTRYTDSLSVFRDEHELVWVLLFRGKKSSTVEHVWCNLHGAYLECYEHHAFHSIADKKQVLQGPKGGHVDAHVHKCDTHEALIRVEGSDEHLMTTMSITNLFNYELQRMKSAPSGPWRRPSIRRTHRQQSPDPWHHPDSEAGA